MISEALQRQMGPLQAWQWGVVIGGGYLGYRVLTGKGLFPSGGGSSGTTVGSTSGGAAIGDPGFNSGGSLGDLPPLTGPAGPAGPPGPQGPPGKPYVKPTLSAHQLHLLHLQALARARARAKAAAAARARARAHHAPAVVGGHIAPPSTTHTSTIVPRPPIAPVPTGAARPT